MKPAQNYLIAAVMVTVGIVPFGIWGWNPYTGFLFALTMCIGGTSTAPPKAGAIDWPMEIVFGLQLLAVITALVTAFWIAGEETFRRILRNPVFLVAVWGWTESIILERYLKGRRIPNSSSSGQAKCTVD
jgi:hypothetical protein